MYDAFRLVPKSYVVVLWLSPIFLNRCVKEASLKKFRRTVARFLSQRFCRGDSYKVYSLGKCSARPGKHPSSLSYCTLWKNGYYHNVFRAVRGSHFGLLRRLFLPLSH